MTSRVHGPLLRRPAAEKSRARSCSSSNDEGLRQLRRRHVDSIAHDDVDQAQSGSCRHHGHHAGNETEECKRYEIEISRDEENEEKPAHQYADAHAGHDPPAGE